MHDIVIINSFPPFRIVNEVSPQPFTPPVDIRFDLRNDDKVAVWEISAFLVIVEWYLKH